MLAAVRALPLLTTAGKRKPDRTRGGGQLRGEPRYRRHHALGARGLGVGAEISSPTRCPALDVHHARLDEGAPDVDTQQFTRHRRFPDKSWPVKGWRRRRAAHRAPAASVDGASTPR